MKRRTQLLAAAAAVAFTASTAQAASLLASRAERTIDFVPTSLLASQNARVTLVNLIPPDPVRVCHVAVSFYDANGDAAGDAQEFDLAPGQSALAIAPSAVILQPPSLTNAAIAAATIRQLRASVQLVRRGRGLIPPDPVDACRGLHAGYEVFDTQSQQTQLMNPGVIRGFNPQPDPPG
jgi:hypothetical protein